MWHSCIAQDDNHAELCTFYKRYYPLHHPLFDFEFWRWQYSNHPEGRCIIVRNDEGKIAGHVGSVCGGTQNFLINILVDKSISGQGLIASLFATARAFGPLTVALANPAGAALLQKKSWCKHPNLQRYVWIHPRYSAWFSEPDFFEGNSEVAALPTPQGYFWQQPGLEGKVLPGNNNATIQGAGGGIRLIELDDAETLVAWAIEHNIKWMDYVCMATDPISNLLVKNGFTLLPSFPWFVDPLDLSRTVELNLFSEENLHDNFLFSRKYSDIARRGSLVKK